MKQLILIVLFVLVFAGITKAQGGWFTLFTEFGVSTTYTGLQFLNGSTGYMTASWGDANNNGGYTIKTTNGGYNWFSAESSVARYGLFFLNEQTGWTFGGYWDNTGKKSREVFKTTNGGLNFQRIYIDSLQQSFRRIYFADINTGWVVTTLNILKTTNSGVNWFTGANLSMNSIFFTDVNTGYGATSTGIVYKTTNGGLNWNIQFVAGGNAFVYVTFINSNTGWVCGNPPDIYKTTNAGSNWIPFGTEATALVSTVEFADSLNGWACSHSGEIFHTTNGGINWLLQITVFDFWLTSLSFPNQMTGYVVGTYFSSPYSHNNKLMKTTTGGVIFVQNIGSEIPKTFILHQNYPNPFNPVTKIKFEIPPLTKGEQGGVVTMIIYDVLGREVATLVNERLKPGVYEVQWDGTDYPSGVYYYQLRTDEYVETRKMVLIK